MSDGFYRGGSYTLRKKNKTQKTQKPMKNSKSTAFSKSWLCFFIVILCVLCPTILVSRLVVLQFIDNDMYQQKAVTQQLRQTEITPNRGTIYDTNMKTLAQSVTVWTIVLNPKSVKDEQQRVLLADELSVILDIDRDVVYEKAGKTNRYYEVLKSKVDHDLYNQVEQFITDNKLTCIYAVQDSERKYPYGSLASSILGFTGTDNYGLSGLEAYYDDELQGTSGWVVQAKSATGQDLPDGYETTYDAVDGANLVLTIDEVIQHYLEKHLDLAASENSVTNRAAGIVMDVNTGAVLAMATTNDFDPNSPLEITDKSVLNKLEKMTDEEEYNKYRTEQLQESWRNKAVSDTYEPGSVFKAFTAAMALEEGVVKQTDMFTCTGAYRPVANHDPNIRCHKHSGHGTVSFRKGLQESCNPVFMQVGARIGAENFYEYFGAFGFRESTGIDLPGEAESVYHSLKTLQNPVSLATDSFGQTFRVTPLQIITAMSSIANGGKLVEPYVVAQKIDNDGNIIESHETVVKRQVISAQTSAELCEMLKSVVDEGAAKNAKLAGYRIAGKTGTSEKRDVYDEQGNQINDLRIASFCGFAPADDPQIAVLIILDEPHASNIYGGTIAAPVAKSVFEDVLPYLGVEPSYTDKELENLDISTPDVTGKDVTQAENTIKASGLKVKIMGNGTQVLGQSPMVGESVMQGGTVVLYTDEMSAQQTVAVPNLIGMSPSEVNNALVNAGLNMTVSGSGLGEGSAVCHRQSIEPNVQVEYGTIIKVDFRYNVVDG